MQSMLDGLRRAVRIVPPALALALATPAAGAAQSVGLGFFGLGLGTRTGVSFSVGVQVTDEVQLICKAGGMPAFAWSTTCGTHLYLMDNPDWFYVAEAGVLGTAPHPAPSGAYTQKRFYFVQGGLGRRDHEFPDDEDADEEPEYIGNASVSWAGGLSLALAKSEREVTRGENGLEYGPRRLSRSIWPLFFWDAQAEVYAPGRGCAKC